ncbi:solute carrier family 23 member 1-like isoform X2 [Centruroides sculpturatus]|uniref:solute carrier family 23 member 1-like isoform X2 n=2 Tax=Centruroides sculpturatus TaxID=218467 RepID=UPI000C6CD7A1|nr:solute carrier family 23 member 1-like isoform X2 [Centruroides sculpturatus]
MDSDISLNNVKQKNFEMDQAHNINGECIEMPAEEKEERSSDCNIHYGVDDVPPWYITIILGIQHYLTMFGGTVAYPYIIAPHLCMRNDDPARGYIISTTFFVSGIVTFIQSTFGVRLPIVQGSSMAFLVPALAILNLPEWQCPLDINGHSNSNHSFTEPEFQEIWQSRMRLIQGSIATAAVFEVAIGFTGLVGFLLRWITPLAITPTIALVGLPLFAEAANHASGNWAIAFLAILLLALFSQYLRDVNIPCCAYRKPNGCIKTGYPIFKLFPVLLTIIVTWLFCVILTAANVFSEGNSARTDLQLSALYESPWFRFPYPGQWGIPTVTTSAVLGILAGVLSSIVESVGDYYACARISGASAPPIHAINRGIFVEGIGCILSGLWGTGSGTTSFSENIGAIGITRVGSRRVVQYGAVVMILFGFLSKFGTLFMTIPEPIIGGIFCVMFSMVTAVGLSNLQYVNLNSTRNLFILGISLFLGICIPKWLQANPGAINTGVPTLDQIFTILLGTNMFVGGFLGFVLDNSIPGTDEERGITKWNKHKTDKNPFKNSNDCYRLPFSDRLNCSFFSYIPICYSYNETNIVNKLKNVNINNRNKEEYTVNVIKL